MSGKNTVDERTGSVNYTGPSEYTYAPRQSTGARTSVYLPTDDMGHVQGHSVGGDEKPHNIVAQSSDLNRAGGGYYNMEKGERSAIKSGASIASSKTAFSMHAGERHSAFMINDQITYQDGYVQEVHLSFANMTKADQAKIQEEIQSLPMDDMPNPGDSLRSSISTQEYADLMTETDAQLPSVASEYAEADYNGVPVSAEAQDSTVTTNAASLPVADSDVADDADANCDADVSTGDDADCDSSADAGADSDPD